MAKTIAFIFVLLLFAQTACNNTNKTTSTKKQKAMQKYEWTEGTSAPLGYPMEVFKGGMSYEGGWTGLGNGVTSGKNGWGYVRSGMSSNFKGLPTHLNFIWMSYIENQFYQINTDIDTEKIREFFQEGYKIKATSGSGRIRHLNYDKICVGMAPGGVVVVWVAGIGVQKEVGRNQGEKITIPDSVIAELDSYENRFWRAGYLNEIFNNGKVIPEEVKKENEGKPIPFGLWDVYRTRFSWKPVFELPDNVKLNPLTDIGIRMINGEWEQLDAAIEPISDYEDRAMPVSFSISLKDNNNIYYEAGYDINEQSCLEAFKTVFGENDPKSTKAELVIKVNEPLSFLTVKIKGKNGKEAFIKTENLEMFKSKIRYQTKN